MIHKLCSRPIYIYYFFAFLLFAFFIPSYAQAREGDTRTVLGRPFTGDGGNAMNAYLDTPQGFALDPDGNIFIADTTNNVIRRIDKNTNVITKFAGSGEFGSKDGFRLLVDFGYPEDIIVDRDGKIYIADTLNNRIRKIDGNTVSTIVSGGISRPRGIMIRGNDLFISDTGNNRIVRTGLNGGRLIEVVRGCSTPTKLTWRGKYLYVVQEGNNSVEEIDLFLGSRQRVAGGFANIGSAAVNGTDLYVVAGPQGVWNEIYRVDLRTKEKVRLQRRLETEMLNWASDIIFKKVVDGNGRVTDTIMYVLFKGGSGIYSFDINGAHEELVAGKHRYGDEYGSRENALVGRPQALALSADGYKIYISQNNKITEFNLITGRLREIAGHVMDSYTEGIGDAARFSDVTSIAASSDGRTLYLADRNNHRIRKLDVRTKETSYLTGAGEINAYNSDNGYQEGGPCPHTFEQGVAGCAYFNRPTGLALSPDEKTLYVAEGSNNRIRGVDVRTGITYHIAGNGEAGYVNGFGPWTKWNGPFTIAASDDGRTLYVADKYNHAIREINIETKNVVTLVNRKGLPGYKEGYAPTALTSIPEYIEIGADGDIYFTEAGNLRVRAVNIASRQTRLISGSGSRGVMNGNKEITRWSGPKGMVRRQNWLFVADFYNDLIKLVNLR